MLKRLDELRMSQQQLADKTEYKSVSSINAILNGTASPPYEKLEAFAIALEMPLAKLMGIKEKNEISAEEPEEAEKINRLIILAGLPASGRSYMVRKMIEAHQDIVMVKRYSTRTKWIAESENEETIEGASKEDIKKCDIRGYGFGVEYGCHSVNIDTVLAEGKSPIVVGGVALIVPLRKIYPNSLSIFLMADPSLQETAMLRQGHTRETIHERMDYQRTVIFDAFNKSLHDFIVPNNYNQVAEEVLNEIIHNSNPNADVKGAINLKSLRR